MTLAAGRLRHRITIQQRKSAQDPGDGSIRTRWRDFATDVAAEIAPLSVKDFIASGAMQSEIIARVTVRYRPGLLASMRIIARSGPFSGQVLNPAGWLPDPDSGLEYVTAPCSLGVNEGE